MGQNIPDTSNYTADPGPNDRDADGSVLIYGEVARLELNTGSGFVVHNWGSWGEHCGYCVCTDLWVAKYENFCWCRSRSGLSLGADGLNGLAPWYKYSVHHKHTEHAAVDANGDAITTHSPKGYTSSRWQRHQFRILTHNRPRTDQTVISPPLASANQEVTRRTMILQQCNINRLPAARHEYGPRLTWNRGEASPHHRIGSRSRVLEVLSLSA